MLALGYGAAIIGIANTESGKKLLGWAAPLGRMAFTNYIAQSIVLGSIFYGSILGIFLVAFFLRFVRGSAVFVAVLVSETLVLVLFYSTKIGYLWYNLIGCAAVCLLSVILERTIFRTSLARASRP